MESDPISAEGRLARGTEEEERSQPLMSRDGADTETIVTALFHDVGELLSPRCHGEIAASLLRPYISEKNYWILQHHEVSSHNQTS